MACASFFATSLPRCPGYDAPIRRIGGVLITDTVKLELAEHHLSDFGALLWLYRASPKIECLLEPSEPPAIGQTRTVGAKAACEAAR